MGQTEAKKAWTSAFLILVLCGAARAAETDPHRRSLVVQAVERASPAVVNISTEQVVERRGGAFPFPHDPAFDEFFQDFFDPRPRRSTQTSLGSGVIVRDDGTILTNEHVILRGSKITVTLADGREFEAKMVGNDADSDLAILRIQKGGKFPTVELGRSDDLMIGETVIAIGNPFGLSHTVTTGVLSAVGRSLRGEDRTYTDFIQTDASINPGNSGGPLLNIDGQLIGINTAIYGKAQGIGFAIPVGRAQRVMRDLVSYGEVKRGWVGLVVQDLTPELEKHFNTRHGVIVTDVEEDSPAARADLQRGDLIVRVDGNEVSSHDEFDQRVEARGVGQEVRITRRRDDDEGDVMLTVSEFPEKKADDIAWNVLGFTVDDDRDGLVVDKVRKGSTAAKIGLERGDRVLGVAGAPVNTVTELRRRLVSIRGSRSVMLSIGRGPYQYNVQVPLAKR
jgi:serine protease Do